MTSANQDFSTHNLILFGDLINGFVFDRQSSLFLSLLLLPCPFYSFRPQSSPFSFRLLLYTFRSHERRSYPGRTFHFQGACHLPGLWRDYEDGSLGLEEFWDFLRAVIAFVGCCSSLRRILGLGRFLRTGMGGTRDRRFFLATCFLDNFSATTSASIQVNGFPIMFC